MDYQTVRKLIETFGQSFGSTDGLRCSRAPGRVNLIGEHTDYNGGFVLPMALNREVRILFRPVGGGPVRLWCENYGEWDEFDLDDIRPNEQQPWANYLRGVAHVLAAAGHALRPIEGIVVGDLPLGAGLSSSAAVEVSMAMALCAAADVEIDSGELALLCQKAENEFVGVNCGIMDQFVSVHATREHALLLDCRSLDFEHVPLDSSAVRIVVCNTMVRHELGSSAYNKRRASCERAAHLLGVPQLRDVTPTMLKEGTGALDSESLKRARHVVGEIERTRLAAGALAEHDYAHFGELMYESHDSLRTDYEVSCDELDAMVEIARDQDGVFGARMTGGGFGGCTVNLVRRECADAFAQAVCEEYVKRTSIEPEVYAFTPAAGASIERC